MGWLGRHLKDHVIPPECGIPVTFPGRDQPASGAGGLVRKSWIQFYVEYPTFQWDIQFCLQEIKILLSHLAVPIFCSKPFFCSLFVLVFHNNKVPVCLSSVTPKMRSALEDSQFSLISIKKDNTFLVFLH